ncbi:hypothetical protein HY68_35675 [Streptomyces sp. AcH 505]|uniref:SGNH/GDSL hydrolase family protein n=1 Tax=Streptomyces sp. AcH 505 TaxID=352211 RepID=UPI000591B7B0|nr:hypothetical protein HY68_35675 [Streptomyces sp. AcH 505]
MHTEKNFSAPSSRLRHHALQRGALLATTAAAVGVLSACGGGQEDAGSGNAPAPSGAHHKTDTRVLWVGDSIAGVEGLPLGAALKAAGTGYQDASSDGGGTVVEGNKTIAPLAQDTWKRLRKDIAAFRPTVIAYQITTYDWGTSDTQRSWYRKLAETAHSAGAGLAIVSAPPFKVDDFYTKYAGAIKTAPKAAAEVADASHGTVHFYDASALWGTDPTAPKAQRSSDGIHSCQQGSAAFAKWFTEKLGKQYGFTPTSPDAWAGGAWTADQRYAKLGCR